MTRAPRGEATRLFEQLCNSPPDHNECVLWPYALNGNGYAVYHDGERSHIASRLLCRRVRGDPPDESFDAAHGCGTRRCLNIAHVDWKTRAGNEDDKIVHGLSNRGERCGSNKIAETDIPWVRLAVLSQTEYAARLGVTQQCISNIQLRKTWAWLN